MSIKSFIKNTNEVLSIKPFHSSSISSTEQQTQNKRLVKFALATSFCLLVLEPSIASAAVGSVTGGTAGTFEAMIQILITWLTGTIAKSVAILAVVFLGFMAMAGKLSMETAGKVILGIVLIFSAAQIVGLLVT